MIAKKVQNENNQTSINSNLIVIQIIISNRNFAFSKHLFICSFFLFLTKNNNNIVKIKCFIEILIK